MKKCPRCDGVGRILQGHYKPLYRDSEGVFQGVIIPAIDIPCPECQEVKEISTEETRGR